MISLRADKRGITGKKVKNIRESGRIPAVLYGAGENSLLLEVNRKDLEKAFREAGESSLVELEVGDAKKNVLIHDVAYGAIKGELLHVDFLQVRMDKPISADVLLEFEGESPAVKNLGGVLVKVVRVIEVEALPQNLPHSINVDLSGLENIEDKFLVKDLKLPEGVTVHTEPEDVLALIEAPREEEEIKTEETEPSLESIEVVGKKKEKTVEGEEEEAAEAEK
ncbi:50S ribosomal protein L25 [Candidatus Giovannonibacteria bacterium]|nr:50S ribosomal protein L25 [Candidatus Giovannonibacteria bacterium]